MYRHRILLATLLFVAPSKSLVRASMHAGEQVDTSSSEKAYDLALPELDGFMEVLRSTRAPDDFNRYLSPVFAGVSPLVPEEWQHLLDTEALTLRRGKSLSTDRQTRDHLEGFLTELLEPMGPSRPDRPLHCEAKIFTTDPNPRFPRRFSTRALVHIDGPARAGGSFQINMGWRIGWEILTPETGTIARIRSIQLESYEDARSRSNLLADITLDTFGEVPRFGEELQRGAGEYHFRSDLLNGNNFIGTNGVAVGDANGDGLEDIFVPQQGGLANRLFLHLPDGGIRDASDASGLAILDPTQSALFLDIDGDGDQDLLLACFDRVWIARNAGEARFTIEPEPLELPGMGGEIQSLAAADWDGDGDIDFYACVYDREGPLGAIPDPYFDATNGPPNAAWQNDGSGGFTEVAAKIGLGQGNHRFSHGAIFEDLDSDGDPDLYVANDFGRNNLYINEDGIFSERALAAGADDMGAAMGVSVGDVDRDGDMDLFVSNTWSSAGNRIVSQLGVSDPKSARRREEFLRYAQGTSLLLNRGDGTFEEAVLPAETRDAGWNFGSLLFDINNDGALDIYAPNGFLTGPVRDDL